MEFLIYLLTEDGEIYYKTMEPEDTIDYKFVLSDKIKIEKDLAKEYDEERIKKINKSQAIVCHTKLMKLRLNIKQYDVPGTKLIKQKKYYVDVLAAYVNFFQGQNFRLTHWRLDEENIIPRYAINLQTGKNVLLSRKQGRFVKLFYNHFVSSKIGDEWMWFSEAYNRLEERYQNPNWESMSDIFEKREGREKLDKLFDVKPEGSRRYYRIKMED
jgi:hypothetical protein